jgi:two-component sensor histidine kinase
VAGISSGLGKISAKQVVIGLALIFLALFISIFGYFISVGVRQTGQRFEEQSAAAAQVIATNAYWIAEVADQTLRRVDAALGPDMAATAADFAPVLDGLPSITEVYVIDADAKTIYSTVPGAQAVSVADREYFTVLRDGAQFYTSPMIVSRLTQDRIFVFSKRVERGGAFAGAIMVSFSGALLEELFGTLNLVPGSTVSLVRDDGELVARFPPADEAVNLSDLPLFTQYLPASPQGTYVSASSPVDGIARVVSYQRVQETELIALASVASGPGWAAFNAAIVTVLFITSPIILGLVLGCWWIIRLLSRDARQTADLKAAADLNTMLFREIHHRVKNNLQSVQALVRLQDIPDVAKRDLQARFAAMAAMHEHIYKHDRYHDIDAHDFVPAVVDQVKAAYGSTAVFRYDIEHLPVDRDHATPLALLLSELITNAFKYAFADGRDGVIDIALKARDDGTATLIVRDNGVGMDLAAERTSMGMRLIRGVVAQMGGSHTFRSDGGLTFEAQLSLLTEQRRAAVA